MKMHKAWKILITCCGLAAASMGLISNSYGVFYNPVCESLGLMKGTFTLHVTIGALVSSFFALYIGKWLYKVKNFKLLIFFGSAVTCTATYFMSMCTGIMGFYILGFIRGIGLNFFCMIPITILINNWFERNVGLATSLVMSFSGIAGAIGSPLFSTIITDYGWQTAYRLLGIISFALCLPAIIYPYAITPEQEGLLPYGLTTPRGKVADGSTSEIRFDFRQKSYILYVIAAVFMTALTCLPAYFPGYAASIQLSVVTGSLMVSASMIGNIVSKLLIGVLSDRIGAFRASVIMLATNLASLIGLMIFRSETSVIFISFFYGAIFSMGSVGIPLLVKEFFGIINYSQAYGKCSFFTGIAGAFGASLIGYIYDFTNTYTVVFALLIALHVVIYFSLLGVSFYTKKRVFFSSD